MNCIPFPLSFIFSYHKLGVSNHYGERIQWKSGSERISNSPLTRTREVWNKWAHEISRIRRQGHNFTFELDVVLGTPKHNATLTTFGCSLIGSTRQTRWENWVRNAKEVIETQVSLWSHLNYTLFKHRVLIKTSEGGKNPQSHGHELLVMKLLHCVVISLVFYEKSGICLAKAPLHILSKCLVSSRSPLSFGFLQL